MSQRVRKLVFVPVLAFFSLSTLTAQTLFTCDGRDVSKADFLKAYNKNNSKEKATEKSYRDYLELYIRYKLKVKAAYDMQLDTLPGQRTELQNFRAQIAENYMKDEESLDRLINEVYARGQKDVRLAHIFFAIPKNAGPADTLKVYEKAWAAYNALKKGKKFQETALANSDDPAVQHNGGDIGYISVFTLPYDLETQAYSTAPGQFTKPFRTKAGYHIFKNEGERKSLGRIKIAQILLAIPPGATESVRTTARLRADSVYDSLLKGADFGQQAKLYSGDNLTYQNQGEVPEFGIGKYDSAFEATAYALDKDGAISRPFLTSFGYHIIKRIYRKPFPHQFTTETAAILKQQVMNDPRIEVSRKALLRKILQQTGFTQAGYQEADLWSFTDSSMTNRALTSLRGLTFPTVLFSFPKQQYTVKEWLDYARIYKASRPNGGNRTDKELFDQYVEKVALDYYRNHLEEYNADFAYQLTEFKEGNLLFEVMQRKIWDKASTDSAGLHNYYETHKDKYWWESSADAVLFTCNNMKTAEELKGKLENHFADWKQLADNEGVSVQADSGRYEWTQIPSGSKPIDAGTITSFAPNKLDNTVSFACILQVYTGRSPRNYRDARGFVINDYQAALEDQWIADLRKKYPVSVNERVLAGLPR